MVVCCMCVWSDFEKLPYPSLPTPTTTWLRLWTEELIGAAVEWAHHCHVCPHSTLLWRRAVDRCPRGRQASFSSPSSLHSSACWCTSRRQVLLPRRVAFSWQRSQSEECAGSEACRHHMRRRGVSGEVRVGTQREGRDEAVRWEGGVSATLGGG